MENGRHGGPERGSVFGFEQFGCRCEVHAMPQMALLAVLDSALREVESVVVGAHPELVDWPAGDERWLHGDYELYTAFSLATMACSLRHLIACYCHRVMRRVRARHGSRASVAGQRQHEHDRKAPDYDSGGATSRSSLPERRG